MLANAFQSSLLTMKNLGGVTPPNLTAIPQKPSMKFASFKNLVFGPNLVGKSLVGSFRWNFPRNPSGFTRVPGRPGPRCCDPSLGFCGKARVTGRDADHQQQPVGWLIGYILFLIETMTQKIPDFLVENDPI